MDSWHLYTVVLNGGYAYCYIDGAEVASFEVTSTHPDNGNIVVNAKSWYGDYNELNTFTIDEMQMWPGAAGPQDVFELWRSLTIDQDWVLSAEMPTPVGIPGSGVNYIDGAMIASASMPNPVHSHGSNLSDGYMTAFGTFMHPNFAAYKNVNFTQTSWTASATFENVTWQVGEYNGAEHMDAYAEMPAAYARIPGIWNAAPWIANATMVNPENIITTKGALIKPQSLNAIAFMVIPPAYYLLTDSLWFTRLYDAYKGNLARFAVGGTTSNDYVTHPSFIKFFNDTSDISVGDIVASQGFYENNATAIGSNITITPKITTGYTDAQNRRAVRLQNISLAFGNGTGSTAGGTTDRGYTLETMIKTTKATQNLFGGSWTSTNVNTNRQSMIGLNNGYLYAMQAYTDGSQVISARDVAKLSSPTLYQATKTNVADGNWHHIVIQMGYDGRLQIWIDGQLELQKYTGSFPYPNIIGQNAYDNTLSTDIYISAIAMNPQYFLTYKNLELNYYAAIDYVPVSAGVMTATATSVDAKARGNRGRALMLYFWSTRGLGNDPIGNSYYKGTSEGLDISLQRNTPYDQGLGGYFDGDTWFKLSTWEGVGREFYDWDIFPVDVQGYYTSPIVNQDSYKNQRTIGYYSGQSPYYYNISDGFVDELDNRRYIDLVNDIDLSDFDMICFRNYPDQQLELESFFRNESVDEYFGTIERELFEKFLTSLRGAVDTGMSLYISNAQLAVDMGIIDRIESVSDLDDNNTVREEIGGGTGDPYSLARVQEIGYQGDVGGLVNGFFYDRYKNNKHRVINTVTGLTDEPGYISTEQAYWEAIDAREFANPNRAWNHIEYRPNGLVIGDEFIWYPNSYVQAVPLANIKAGKAVTTFSSSYRRGTVLTDNPYNTYATTIVVEPGDVLNGKQVAGKIFVNFTELPEVEDERNTIELKSDYWLDIAKADGTIDETTYNQYKNSQTYNVDRKLEANLIDQDEYDYEKYWSMNGWNVIASAVEYPGSPTKLTVYSNSSGVRTKTKAITSKGRKKGVDTGTGGGTAPVFLVEWGFLNPVIDVRTLSMISRGLIWLSERANYSGIINRPLAVTAEATMVDPTVVADKDLTVNVQSMLASATINEVKNNIPNRNIVSLPMTATALINGFTKPYFATPGTVTAYMPQNVIASSFDTDQIVLYVMHTDPILYVREDVIK
jgi:hypothetical protein